MMLVLACVTTVSCLSPSVSEQNVRMAMAEKAETLASEATNSVQDIFAPFAALAETGQVRVTSCDEALLLATRHSRQLQDQRDALFRQGLGLLRVRRGFGIELDGTAQYVFNRDDEGSNTSEGGLAVGASQILPTGGKALAAVSSTGRDAGATNEASSLLYDTSASLRIDQPLLAGAGYEASHGELIQSERDLLYALRSFALQRQDFAIRVRSRYYELLTRRAAVVNTRRNLEQSVLLEQRSDALFKVGRAPAIDVLRSRQQVLLASNVLAKAETDFDIQSRRFGLDLGLPVTLGCSVEGEIPPLRPLHLDESACIRQALTNRLDLKTTRERVADAERNLRTARRNLLPEVNVFGEIKSTRTDSGDSEGVESESTSSGGVRMNLPLDQRDERDAVRQAERDLDAARRAWDQKEDEVRIEISDNFRNLQFQADTVEIERRNIEIAEKRARHALLQFRNGKLENRDVVEAENTLLAARNAYVQALTGYEVQRTQLMRDMGCLDVAVDGRLIEKLTHAPDGVRGEEGDHEVR
jgi:outer membrane protein TolC